MSRSHDDVETVPQRGVVADKRALVALTVCA
jgi:hypothetical protein